MNFHSLPRRDLQFLCKKNRIPANLTNVAMAKALEALKTVEGIEEIQEALGIRSPKLNSPELPHIGKKTFTREVTHGCEPQIKQQQKPSPMPRSQRGTVKALEVTKMASNEEEVQEGLGFQSLNVKSPELPHTARRTSARRATHREKPSPLHRSCLKSSIALEKEGEKKKVPQILPKTPATRKAARGVEAQSSGRMVKKNEEVQENLGFQSLNVKSPELPHTARRTSARRAAHREKLSPLHRSCLKLSIALEEEGEKKKVPQISPKTPATRIAARGVEAQSSRRKVKKNEDVECHTKTPKEVEAKGQKAIGAVTRRSTRLSSRNALEESVTTQSKSKSSSSRKNSAVKMEALAKEDAGEEEKKEAKKNFVKYGEIENECEAKYENAHDIQQEKGRLHPPSNRVNTKALEATIEEKVTIVDLIEEKAGEQEKEEDKRELAEKNDSCAVALVEANKEEDKKEERHGYSSSSEVINDDSTAPLFEEVEENNQEVENLCFSSSSQVEDSNIEVENGDSTVSLVEGCEKNDEELEIQVSSLSIEMQDSNDETASKVFNVVHVEEKGRNDPKEGHELYSFCVENSMEHCNDQSPENDLVDNASNIVPTNEAVEDSSVVAVIEANKEDDKKEESHGYSSSSEVKNDDSIAPLVEEVEKNNQKVENLCFSSSTQVDSIIEVENGNSTVDAQGTSSESQILVSSIELCTKISAADSTIEWSDKDANELHCVIKESFEDSSADSSELIANVFVDVRQKEETLKDYFFELQIPVSPAALCSDFLTVDSTIESHRVDHLSENLQESGEDDYLHKLAANESFKVSQKIENYQSGSFNLRNPVSCSKHCFELSTVDSNIDFKESFGNLSSEISGSIDESVAETSQDASFEPQIPVPSPAELCVGFSSSEISGSIEESVAAGLPKSDEITYEKYVYAETSQVASSEPQIPVPSPGELLVELSSTSLETICSPLKLSCVAETSSLLEPSIFQTQPSEQVPIATTETAEEKEETKIKASEKEVFLKGENLELMSLRKLRAMYKQMVNGPKTDEKKRYMMIKPQDLECLRRSKLDSSNKQKLNDNITKSEKKRSVIKQQQDLECLSRSKVDSNNNQKFDEFMSGRKRTPLKNLNYKIDF